MYKQVNNSCGISTCILRLTDGAFIPFDPENADYQEYLKWVESGNTPEPADE